MSCARFPRCRSENWRLQVSRPASASPSGTESKRAFTGECPGAFASKRAIGALKGTWNRRPHEAPARQCPGRDAGTSARPVDVPVSPSPPAVVTLNVPPTKSKPVMSFAASPEETADPPSSPRVAVWVDGKAPRPSVSGAVGKAAATAGVRNTQPNVYDDEGQARGGLG